MIAVVTCACGCGRKTTIHRGVQRQWIRGHARSRAPVSPVLWVADPAGCWIWQRAKNRQGYGTLRVGGRQYVAHRWVYELLVGPIPEGLHLDHLCDTKSCVRPAHLEPVTKGENERRYWEKRREGVVPV